MKSTAPDQKREPLFQKTRPNEEAKAERSKSVSEIRIKGSRQEFYDQKAAKVMSGVAHIPLRRILHPVVKVSKKRKFEAIRSLSTAGRPEDRLGRHPAKMLKLTK